MCGGFSCSKNALIALNLLYVMVGCLLIGVGVYARAASIVTNLPIVTGIVACGVILILISVLGLAGAVQHHQVMLFFYMIILFLLFLIQFSIASSCLAVPAEDQRHLAEEGWKKVPQQIRNDVQNKFICCGFNETSNAINDGTCDVINKRCESELTGKCPPCGPKLEEKINDAFKLCGGLGIFFSFTEFIGVWLTVRYRNQKDPRGLPSAFL